MTKDHRIIVILLLGLSTIFIILGTQWFNNNFAYKDVEKHSGYSTEAKRNKFLAAEYYLRELGHDVESDSNRSRLLEEHLDYQTIIINDYGPKLSQTHFNKLINWIENGGHLIFTANNFQYVADESNDNDYDYDYTDHEFRHNQLLKKYGIKARYTNFTKHLSVFNDHDSITYTLNKNTNINIYFEPDRHLIDSYGLSAFSLTSPFGTHLLQIDIKKGKLTVLSDNLFLSNTYIGKHDHAFLASYLNQNISSMGKKILLLYNNQSDSIFTLIWKYAKHACIAFIALIIIFLWSLQNRFGPIIATINDSNRNIIEHLKAIGRFSWRLDHGAHLLNHSRIACENSLIKRYPALKQMPTHERLEHISSILDITPEKVHHALYYQPTSTNEFITSSHYLQKIWILQ